MSNHDDEQIIITRTELEAIRSWWYIAEGEEEDVIAALLDRNPPPDPDAEIIRAIALALLEAADNTSDWQEDLLECDRDAYIADAKAALAAARKAGADL